MRREGKGGVLERGLWVTWIQEQSRVHEAGIAERDSRAIRTARPIRGVAIRSAQEEEHEHEQDSDRCGFNIVRASMYPT